MKEGVYLSRNGKDVAIYEVDGHVYFIWHRKGRRFALTKEKLSRWTYIGPL
jgi:hypothetical protein